MPYLKGNFEALTDVKTPECLKVQYIYEVNGSMCKCHSLEILCPCPCSIFVETLIATKGIIFLYLLSASFTRM